MDNVQQFINNPDDNDVPIEHIFTNSMFKELKSLMLANGWAISAIEQTEQLWETEYKTRKIVSGFMKDKILGKKRLASMPDRMTNTIDTKNGSTVYRVFSPPSPPFTHKAHKAQSTMHKAQSTKHKAQSTKYKTQSTKHEAQNSKHKAQSTKHKA